MWRLTYSEEGGSRGSVDENVEIYGRKEIRNDLGEIYRLSDTGVLKILPSSSVEIYGECFIKNFLSKGGKYRTSCWMKSLDSSSVDIFCNTIAENTDVIMAITGGLVIYEYDEQGKAFPIISMSEGKKAIIKYDPKAEKIIDRYSAKVEDITLEEMDLVVSKYMHPVKWAYSTEKQLKDGVSQYTSALFQNKR